MTIPQYPAGLALCKLTGTLAFGSGTVYVECERKFGYQGTDWMMPEFFQQDYNSRSIGLYLPFSDAPGRLGDNGAALTDRVGYKITFYPDSTRAVKGPGITQLLMADGPTRVLWLVTGLGDWPNRTLRVEVPVPGSGGTGGTMTTVETPPGSGEYKVTVT